uniref:No apical meristem-associated C-terminal domain-containing protein n=1 Tax=Brassica oleracea var. oleracea TaxID=109376 RepID=A0A0D3ACF4_BRAOL
MAEKKRSPSKSKGLRLVRKRARRWLVITVYATGLVVRRKSQVARHVNERNLSRGSAHEIFYNNHKNKFTLEHAWKELRNDQKWCDPYSAKNDGGSKKRKCDDGADSPSSQATEAKRPAGVKAAKAVRMWDIKQQDLAMKEMLSEMSLLDSLIAKKEPLAEYEEALKKKLISDLIETPTYPENLFQRRFRMNKPLFMHIIDRLSNEVQFFCQKKDSLGRLGLSPLQKCTAAIRVLAYGSAADAVDEYFRLGETTTRKCLENFVEGIIYLFSDEYLRRPTPADLQRLLDIGEHRGFSGMIRSIDCMHWEWKNCPTAWKGQYSRGSGKPTIVLEAVTSYDLWIWHAFFGPPGTLNDINVLDRPPVFDDIINGQTPQDKVKIGKIMRACIILHNMIVEDERDGYTQFDVSEFQQGEDTGSSHVDLTYSTDIPTNIANMMGV